MSRSDKPRRPRFRGHRTSVHHVRLYGGQTADQSICSCGERGHLRAAWHLANQDGRDHLERVNRDASVSQ